MKKKIILISITLFLILFCFLLISFLFKNDKDNIIISIEDSEIRVKHSFTEKNNMIVVYNQNRNNNFFDFSQFILQDIDKDTDDFSGEVIMSTSTDFISPYGLLAIENSVNENSFTVGGAHATNGSNGFPTGRFDQIEYLKLDNRSINSNGIYKGEKLDFKVNHFVFASNVISNDKNRDSLLEERYYSITNMNHEVRVKLTALEDVLLTRYAGLQMIQPQFYDFFYFPGLEKTYKIKGELPGQHTLDEDSFEKIDRAVLVNKNSLLIMHTNRNYGIGTGKFSPKNTKENPQSPITFTGGEFGKIYSHNLGRNNAELELEKGKSLEYKGGYYFRERKNMNSSKVSYEINNKWYTDKINIKD